MIDSTCCRDLSPSMDVLVDGDGLYVCNHNKHSSTN